MSYLDVPRIHFFGRFYADPSTINNYDENFATDNPSPLWNPSGTHFFRFQNCAVSSVRGLDGNLLLHPEEDAIIGMPVRSAEEQGVAKLVDLDTDQQGISAVFGHRITLTEGSICLTGDMGTAEANELWNTVIPPVVFGQPASNLTTSAYFQTIVKVSDASWPATSLSKIFDQLRAACDLEGGNRLLSLRFVCDGFIDIPGPQFKTGRIVGTFGPGKTNEPRQCLTHRRLSPRPTPTGQKPPWNFYIFNRAPFLVDETRMKLVVDLSNSIPFTTASGPPPNLGQMLAQIAPAGGQPETIGPIDYSDAAHNNCAGVVETDLSQTQIDLLRSNPLQLKVTSIGAGQPEVLLEAPNGIDFVAEDRAFRMAFDDNRSRVQTTKVYVTKFGQPFAMTLAAGLLATGSDAQGQPALPDKADTLSVTMTPSGQDGIATLTLTATGDPGKPADRPGSLTGQLFRIGLFETPPGPLPSITHPGEQTVSARLFASYAIPANPVWKDVFDLMAPYKPLYPGMFQILDLTNEAAFAGSANMIVQRFSQPFDSAGYMPVTRDMPANQIATIVKFVSQLHSQNIVELAPQTKSLNLPYQISFEEMSYGTGPSGLPSLQSYSAAVSQTTGYWLVFGGLTGGGHSFIADAYSVYITAFDPATGRYWQFDVRKLPAELGDKLRFNNGQMAPGRIPGIAYLVGGFGLDSSNEEFTTFQTITKVDIDQLIAAIQNPNVDPNSIAAMLPQATDERFAVTGGVMVNSEFHYLVFGHRSKALVSNPVAPTALDRYTEEVRRFLIEPDPATLGIRESSYGSLVDSGDHAFHRRDLNVVPAINPDNGEERLAAFGGVFQFGQMKPFTTPIYIERNCTATEDLSFHQKMNVYECPAIPAYDENSKTMSYTFFGGIAEWRFENGSLHRDDSLPWSNQACMVIHEAGGQYHEIIIPDAIPGGRHLGADAQFHFVPGLAAAGQLLENGVIKLTGFQPGTKTLIGYIYGGIEAAAGNTRLEKTTASNRVFAVYLTNSPLPGTSVS